MTLLVFVFSCGVLAAPIFHSSWPFWPILFALATLVVLGGLTKFLVLYPRQNKPIHAATAQTVTNRFSLVLMLLILGLAAGRAHLGVLLAHQLPHQFDRTNIEASFVVASIPKRSKQFTAFRVNLISSNCQGEACTVLAGQTLIVRWYRSFEQVNAGDVWHGQLRLKRPRGLVNPAAFDYHLWLLSEGIMATASITKNGATKLGQQKNLAYWRSRLNSHLFGEYEYKFERFFKALLLGDTSGLSTQDWDTLKATGTIHLMAISGLHVGLMASIAFGIGCFAARLFSLVSGSSNAVLMFRLPPLMAVLAALVYATLAGFSVPTTRAFTACACVCACLLLNRKTTPGFILAVALAAIALSQPFAIFASGFWLSFGAVGVLFWAFVGRKQRKFVTLIYAQGVLFIGLLPILMCQGQGASWVSPIANLVAVPVVAMCIVPGVFLALFASVVPGLAAVVLHALDFIFTYLWHFLEVLSAWSPQWLFSFAAPINALLLQASALLLMAPKGLSVRVVGLILGASVFALPAATNDSVKLTVLDAGQGLAVVFQAQDQTTWVFDTGARFSDSFDIGSGAIVPYLNSQGISSINLMVSHNDGDHAGGAKGLAKHIGINKLFSGEPLSLPGAQRKACQQGQVLQSKHLKLEVLWPQRPDHSDNNDASCVVLATFVRGERTVSVLLPGDITSKVEGKILKLLPENGVDVLLAPHHGSNTSSSAAFIRAVNPKYVVFSAGYKNQYLHPSEKVLQRYQQQGAIQLDTASSGAITFNWDNSGRLKLEQLRKTNGRLWY